MKSLRNELKEIEMFPQKRTNDLTINILKESSKSQNLIKSNEENIMISVNIQYQYIQEGNLSIEDANKDSK